jgi:hypothetical protein
MRALCGIQVLTKGQSDQLEIIQRHALNIISSCNLDYKSACFMSNLETLADRREKLTHRLFTQMKNPSHCLHHLLPAERDLSRYCLRSSLPYHIPTARTTRFKNSFLIHALEHYQLDN